MIQEKKLAIIVFIIFMWTVGISAGYGGYSGYGQQSSQDPYGENAAYGQEVRRSNSWKESQRNDVMQEGLAKKAEMHQLGQQQKGIGRALQPTKSNLSWWQQLRQGRQARPSQPSSKAQSVGRSAPSSSYSSGPWASSGQWGDE